ncbi:MAG: SDR family oxidoreductase [Patescibacteria group bacterium]
MIPRTLLIGASGSLGLAVSDELIKGGHSLLLTFRSKANLSNVAPRIKNSSDHVTVSPVLLDVTSEASIKRFYHSNKSKLGNLVYMVGAPLVFKKLTEEGWLDFTRHLEVQVKGLFLLVKHLPVISHMKNIVVIGSSGVRGMPPSRLASYIVAKHALAGLVKVMAMELAPMGVRVNMVSPGVMGDGLTKQYPLHLLDLIKSKTPLRRLVLPKDVATAVRFLLDPSTDHLTGLDLPVDGGLSII